MQQDRAFQMSASNVRFGPGVTREVGLDLVEMSVKRTLVVVDPKLRDLAAGQTVFAALKENRVDFDVFSDLSLFR